MSSSSELQQLIFETLTGNGAIMALANGVYDRVPTNPFGEKTAYISFGSEDANEDDAEGIDGLEATTQIDIWSRAGGRVECKNLTALVRKALHEKELQLPTSALVEIRVVLTRIFADPDGETTHGVVQVTAMIEEFE